MKIKGVTKNLVRLIILVLLVIVLFVLYFIYKKGFEGMDDISMPDESLYYKTKAEILRNAAQANN